MSESMPPLPEISELTEPFWTAARERRLVVQRCEACGALRFPPEPGCYACASLEVTWAEMSGRAALWSWTIGHPPLLPHFAERAPWPVAVVQLDEGPRMVTNIIDATPDEYEIGMPLTADYQDVAEDVTLVVFRRA